MTNVVRLTLVPIYYWAKYDIKEAYGYGLKKYRETTIKFNISNTNRLIQYTGYKKCEIDPITGERIMSEYGTYDNPVGVYTVSNIYGQVIITLVTSHKTTYSQHYTQQWFSTVVYNAVEYIIDDNVMIGDVKGDNYKEDVKSKARNAYPDNGTKGGYWYVFQGKLTI